MGWIDVGHANGLFQSPDGTGVALNGTIRGAHPDSTWVYFYGNTNFPKSLEILKVKFVLAPVSGWDNDFISFWSEFSNDTDLPCSLNSSVQYFSDWGRVLHEPQEIIFEYPLLISTDFLAGCDTGHENNTSNALQVSFQQGFYASYNMYRWEIVSVEAWVEASDFWTGNVGTVEVAI